VLLHKTFPLTSILLYTSISVDGLNINPSGDLTIYRQIVAQVLDAAAGGRIKPGEPLPSLEKTALRHGISPLTVKKAYDELERKGVVETRRGLGTFLKNMAPEGRESRMKKCGPPRVNSLFRPN